MVKDKLEHLFRHEYARWVAILTSRYGTSNIDIVEDAVQEALYKAMRLWSFEKMPDNPSAWLFRTASNHIIDVLRRDSRTKLEIPVKDDVVTEFYSEPLIQDEQVKMIFACCHPHLSEYDQILLNLKLNFALGNKEIGKILYKSPGATKKAITRAKKRFRENVSKIETPDHAGFQARLNKVTKVIYLIFTAGYNAYTGNTLNKELCNDALRMASYINRHEKLNTNSLKGLMALMCFKISRFPSRLDDQGKLVTLEHQDRSLWNKELMEVGRRFLFSSENHVINQYQIEASIEHEYCFAAKYDDIDWPFILDCYEVLLKINPAPAVKLNRLVVLEMVKGTQAAWEELGLLDENTFKTSHLYYAIKGKFEKALDLDDYQRSKAKAIALSPSNKEKVHLQELFDNTIELVS